MSLIIPSFCLCLDKRRDLWSGLEQQINELGWPFYKFVVGQGNILPKEEYSRIDRPKEECPPNWIYGQPEYKYRHWNAFLSHHEMIQYAKDQKWERFLLLEDDALILKRFKHIWPLLESKIVNNQLTYLGWWHSNEWDEWNTNIEQEYKFNGTCGLVNIYPIGGLHAVIIHQSMYDFLLSLQPIDCIDAQLNRFKVHEQVASQIVIPKIINVHDTFSYCEGSFVTRKSLE